MRIVIFDDNVEPINSLDNYGSETIQGKTLFKVHTYKKHNQDLTKEEINEIKILMRIYYDIFFENEKETNKIMKRVDEAESDNIVEIFKKDSTH